MSNNDEVKIEYNEDNEEISIGRLFAGIAVALGLGFVLFVGSCFVGIAGAGAVGPAICSVILAIISFAMFIKSENSKARLVAFLIFFTLIKSLFWLIPWASNANVDTHFLAKLPAAIFLTAILFFFRDKLKFNKKATQITFYVLLLIYFVIW